MSTKLVVYCDVCNVEITEEAFDKAYKIELPEEWKDDELGQYVEKPALVDLCGLDCLCKWMDQHIASKKSIYKGAQEE